MSQIADKVKELKKTGIKVLSNCYIPLSRIVDTSEVYEANNTIVFTMKEDSGEFERVYFYTCDLKELSEVLGGVKGHKVLEVVSKARDDFEASIIEGGFTSKTKLKRVVNADINNYFNNTMQDVVSTKEPEYAALSDAEEIYNMLWNTFDENISHLPTLDEIKGFIEDKQFVIVKSSDRIVSLLQEIVEPRRYYVNQVINFGDKEDFHAMIKSSLNKYRQNGGKYTYAWVEEGNIASLKFFKKYGIVEDGLWTSVYVKNSN